MASKRLVRILVVVGLLALLGFLFLRSVRGTRSEPYTVERASVGPWTLALEPAEGPTGPVLVLRAPPSLVHELSKQIFTRAMESLISPAQAAIPLVLRGEAERASSGRVTPEALEAAAREAGLESASPQPRCLAYRRVSSTLGTVQLYFVLFDAPEIARFRERVRPLLATGGGPGAEFDPAALSPVMIVSATTHDFERWLPLHADPRTDCVAPIVVK